MNPPRDFEVVVWGATGFTGQLVAEHLSRNYGSNQPLRWALGGRNQAKLEELAGHLATSSGPLPMLVGDSHDRESLDRIVCRTSVVCSTVGPYARHGSELVASCVEHGTHYCDLSGEVQWMRAMIDRHDAHARQTGARIVHCCGFDSIPSDLGCYFLQKHVQSEHHAVCGVVKLRVRTMRGAFSGGTIASLLNVLDEARRNPRVWQLVKDPYALNPRDERNGPDLPDRHVVQWDGDLHQWTAPFLMAPINTRVVRRTNALLNYAYGRDFRYDEAVLAGSGPLGWTKAQGMANGLKLFLAAAAARPTRAALTKWILPTPGEGPTTQQRAEGYFEVQLVGKPDMDSPEHWSALVRGDQDPGYGTTSKMLAESAVCLAQDTDKLDVPGGFWTPASCLGMTLLPRLEARAGMRFTLK